MPSVYCIALEQHIWLKDCSILNFFKLFQKEYTLATLLPNRGHRPPQRQAWRRASAAGVQLPAALARQPVAAEHAVLLAGRQHRQHGVQVSGTTKQVHTTTLKILVSKCLVC